MRDNKRGTIEDRSSDRLLALAYEQGKGEALLELAQAKDCGDCPGAQCGDCPRWLEPGTVDEAEFGPRVLPGDTVETWSERRKTDRRLSEVASEALVDTRDMNYGAASTLTVCIAALSHGIASGLLLTPEDCVAVLMRVQIHFATAPAR